MEWIEFQRQRQDLLAKQNRNRDRNRHAIPVVEKFLAFAEKKFGSIGGLFRSVETFAVNRRNGFKDSLKRDAERARAQGP